MRYTTFDSSIGRILLLGTTDGLQSIQLQGGKGKEFGLKRDWVYDEELFSEAVMQIHQYLAKERKEFSLQLNMIGTPFQLRVWKALSLIPYGQVLSYKAIAQMVGVKKGARAVGMANAKNPLPLVIPCHRVIGANGKLTGYAYGIELKKKLLGLEGVLLDS